LASSISGLFEMENVDLTYPETIFARRRRQEGESSGAPAARGLRFDHGRKSLLDTMFDLPCLDRRSSRS